YFLDSLAIRDYIGAYTILGSELQSKMSYPDFRENYIRIAGMTYDTFDSQVTDNHHVRTTVNATIEIKPPSQDGTTAETRTLTLSTGYENDQLKILKISQKKTG